MASRTSPAIAFGCQFKPTGEEIEKETNALRKFRPGWGASPWQPSQQRLLSVAAEQRSTSRDFFLSSDRDVDHGPTRRNRKRAVLSSGTAERLLKYLHAAEK